MKSNSGLCFTVCIILFLAFMNIASANEFKVGDDLGWKESGVNETSMYNQWAENNRFQVGDTLDFEYNKNETVLRVEKWGYYHCNKNKTIVGYKNGKSIVKLDKAGPFYFISASLQHCMKGQRLLVQVMSSHPIPDYYNSPAPAPAPASSSAVSLSFKFLSLIAPLVAASVWFVLLCMH